MRVVARTVPALALALLAGAAPGAARAHPLLVETVVAIDTPTDLPITILADEATALVAVEIEAPDGYTFLDVTAPGFTASHTETEVRLSGKTIAIGEQSAITVRGFAHRAGRIVLAVVTHAADGRERRWDGASTLSPFPGVLVDVTGLAAPAGKSSAGTYVLVAAFLLVVAAGVLALRRQKKESS